jgi:hypothetical protein
VTMATTSKREGLQLDESEWTKLRESTKSINWEIFPVCNDEYGRIYSPGMKVWVMMSGKPFAQAVVVEEDHKTTEATKGQQQQEDEEEDEENKNKFEGRVRVQYKDGTFYHCRPGRLCPIYEQCSDSSDNNSVSTPATTTIVVTAETKNYRKLARLQPKVGEFALEIGSDLGACTAVLDNTVKGIPNHEDDDDGNDKINQHSKDVAAAPTTIQGKALGIDKSSQSIAEAKIRYPNITFECMDVLTAKSPNSLREVSAYGLQIPPPHDKPHDNRSSDTTILSTSTPPLPPPPLFDVVFIDINGNRMLEAVAQVISLVLEVMSDDKSGKVKAPRLIVVKSSEMVRAMMTSDSTGNKRMSKNQERKERKKQKKMSK